METARATVSMKQEQADQLASRHHVWVNQAKGNIASRVSPAQDISAGPRFREGYLKSAVLILTVTACGKAVTLLVGEEVTLLQKDPLLGISNKLVLLLAVSLEFGTVLLTILSRNPYAPSAVLAMLSAQFIAYRVALSLGGFPAGCPCVGRLGDWLPVSRRVWAGLLWLMAVWLFVGALFALRGLRRAMFRENMQPRAYYWEKGTS